MLLRLAFNSVEQSRGNFVVGLVKPDYQVIHFREMYLMFCVVWSYFTLFPGLLDFQGLVHADSSAEGFLVAPGVSSSVYTDQWSATGQRSVFCRPLCGSLFLGILPCKCWVLCPPATPISVS
jgi:hypothetical protein